MKSVWFRSEPPLLNPPRFGFVDTLFPAWVVGCCMFVAVTLVVHNGQIGHYSHKGTWQMAAVIGGLALFVAFSVVIGGIQLLELCDGLALHRDYRAEQRKRCWTVADGAVEALGEEALCLLESLAMGDGSLLEREGVKGEQARWDLETLKEAGLVKVDDKRGELEIYRHPEIAALATSERARREAILEAPQPRPGRLSRPSALA